MTSILENISTGLRCTCHHPRIIHKWHNEINQHNILRWRFYELMKSIDYVLEFA